MIDSTPQPQYPLFFPCSQKQWQELEDKANTLLGFPNEGADNYSTPTVDKNGQYYFCVNPEVASLVDVSKCVQYSDIQFETINSAMGQEIAVD